MERRRAARRSLPGVWGPEGIAPVLAPFAALGVVLLMLGAALTHLRRREAAGIAISLVLLTLTVVVAWGRFGPHSITA